LQSHFKRASLKCSCGLERCESLCGVYTGGYGNSYRAVEKSATEELSAEKRAAEVLVV
jgi:hypothetical protein